MEQKSMTALVSAFSRAYHSLNNEVKIFDDTVAKKLLTEEEYTQISQYMTDGISFFNPSFMGDTQEALRWVVDHQLSPSTLGRAAFAEKSLERAVQIGARQYLIFGAGYDTFGYRQPSWAKALEIFEIDHPATARDKQARLKIGNFVIPDNVHYIEADFAEDAWQEKLLHDKAFDCSKISCGTILGVAYYLSKQTFETLIWVISAMVPKGSSLIFDYPDENSYTEKAGDRAKKQVMLAGGANEKMLASYSYAEMEQLLAGHDFLIYEHLTPQDVTKEYFEAYNRANPAHKMTAFDNVNYCLAVRK
jgi:methyltransferase (TIGR00027 family)